MQAINDLRQRQCPNPRSRQFDRKGHPVEATTDLRDGGAVLPVDGETGRYAPDVRFIDARWQPVTSALPEGLRVSRAVLYGTGNASTLNLGATFTSLAAHTLNPAIRWRRVRISARLKGRW
jgi:hypothetical protein